MGMYDEDGFAPANGLIIGLLSWLIVLLVIYNRAYAVTFSWTAPTTNVDGTLLTDLAGFNIYCGAKSRTYTVKVNVPGAGVTMWKDNDVLVPKKTRRYCAVTAYDTSGNESAYSTEVIADFLAPASPW